MATRKAKTAAAQAPAPVDDDTVDGGALLEDLKLAIRRFVVVSSEQLLTLALWVLHTHALEASNRTPYLHIRSATPRCGKSRLFDVLEHLVAKPRRAEQVTVAVLSRMIDAEEPTLLLDESDQAFKSNDDYRSGLTAILNGGIRRGGTRTVATRGNGGFVVQDLATFCPKALAGIGKLPESVADRCIPIEMKRRLANEPIERFYEDTAVPELRALGDRSARWAQQNISRLAATRPEPLEALHDRADEAWQPLFAIAELISQQVTDETRRAAISLMADQLSEEDEYGVRLLQDIAAVFDETGNDRIGTVALIRGLAAEPTAFWHHWWNAYNSEPTPGAARALAKTLAPFGIQPGTIRIKDANLKGYYRHQFIDSWNRYEITYASTADPKPAEASTDRRQQGEADDQESKP